MSLLCATSLRGTRSCPVLGHHLSRGTLGRAGLPDPAPGPDVTQVLGHGPPDRRVGFHLTSDLVTCRVDLRAQEPPGGFEARGAKLSLSAGAVVTKYLRLCGSVAGDSHSSGGAKPQIEVPGGSGSRREPHPGLQRATSCVPTRRGGRERERERASLAVVFLPHHTRALIPS